MLNMGTILSGDSKETTPKASGNTLRVQIGIELTDEQVTASTEAYTAFREAEDEACKIGLYGHDLEAVLKSKETILFEYSTEGGDVFLPLLVPVHNLEWYNAEALEKAYGQDTDIYYYAHPPIPDDLACIGDLANELKRITEDGSVIIFDQYADKELPSPLMKLIGDGLHSKEYIGGEESKKIAPVFAGKVEFDGIQEVKEAPSLFEAYKIAIDSGELIVDEENGVSLVASFDDENAKKIWDIVYEQKFQELGESDPIYAGFDEKSLMDILKNPETAKIVLKENGKFKALCFFDNDFEHYPWFNKTYFKEKYPEYYETKNIFIFPGIVAAEEADSVTNAIKMISFAVKIAAKRGSNTMVTFECTQTSAQYIPKLTWFSVNHSGVAKVEDSVKNPISTMEYFAVKKAA